MSAQIKPTMLAGWGNYPQATFHYAEPADVPTDCQNFENFPHLIARGMGRSYGDASLASAESLAVGTRWHNKFIAFDCVQGLLTAQAGVSLGEILDVIVPAGWFLPVTPGTRQVSLGGALASNIHGKNHHHCGAIVNFVHSLDVLTETGGFECSPTSRADLFYATIGGYGLTGIIRQATLRLRKIETAKIATRLIKVANLDAALAVDQEFDSRYEYSVTWLDGLARGRNLGRGIVMLGNHATRAELSGSDVARPLENRWQKPLTAPKYFPGWVLNNVTNRCFNFAYAHRFLARESESLSNFEPWFYPLDRVTQWNRCYGRAGFVEYQCALPMANAAAGMKLILEHVHRAGLGSFLAVYKKISGDGVTMPFAMPGYTLALDFGRRQPRLFDILDELDRLVIRHGGKVYLSKDARLQADIFREMYPEYASWREVVARYGPERRFRSRLAERLQL